MNNYLSLLSDILETGVVKDDRTGVGTRSKFGEHLVFDLNDGFPLMTTKEVNFKAVVHELLWLLSGDTNIKYLQNHGVHIWDKWADEEGNLGPVYGAQWREWKGKDGKTVDQISQLIDLIKNEPDSRRLIVSAWNVADLDEMNLPPCHAFFQFYVSGEKLSCQLYQRSADIFLGVPFNIASYSLLLMMVAQVTGLKPDKFYHAFGDVHLYENHIDQAMLQLGRTPKKLPRIELNSSIKDIFKFRYEDISLLDYRFDEKIVAEVAI